MHWGLKEVANPSELQLQTAVGCPAYYMGLRIWTEIFLRHSIVSEPLSRLSMLSSTLPNCTHYSQDEAVFYIRRWSEGSDRHWVWGRERSWDFIMWVPITTFKICEEVQTLSISHFQTMIGYRQLKPRKSKPLIRRDKGSFNFRQWELG